MRGISKAKTGFQVEKGKTVFLKFSEKGFPKLNQVIAGNKKKKVSHTYLRKGFPMLKMVAAERKDKNCF